MLYVGDSEGPVPVGNGTSETTLFAHEFVRMNVPSMEQNIKIQG